MTFAEDDDDDADVEEEEVPFFLYVMHILHILLH